MNDIKDITAVSAVEFKKHFGRYREEAQRAPVGITNHGRVSSVLISAAAYAEFLKLKPRDTRKAFLASEATPEHYKAITEADYGPSDPKLENLMG